MEKQQQKNSEPKSEIKGENEEKGQKIVEEGEKK